MYGLWLYKEIKTEYGYCKVEIHRKNYAGNAIEIGALEANSLTIALENLGETTSPIGKSVCSFAIIDTDQINYDNFFTPDATALKVIVSTKVGNGSYVTRWSGYVTPDFFAENLSYRTPISISARDNIGYLNDVDFDLVQSTITVREFILAAFAKIAADYPMGIEFVTQKQTAEGVLAIDATISTILLREMSWGKALETICHDLGLQLRWVDNNTIAVLDLSQIPEYYATQGFNFVGASGYREIAPAWRQLSQSQDYGLRENFFEGEINSNNITYAKDEVLRANLPVFQGSNTTTIRYYTPNNWSKAGEMYTINPADFFNGEDLYKGRMFYTGIQSNIVNYPLNYMSWRQPILQSNWPMLIKFKAYNAIMAPDSTFGTTLQNLTLYPDSEDRYQLGVKVNVLLHSGTTTYILRQDWEVLSGNENTAIEFILPELTHNGTPQEKELSIDIDTIPYDGDLELRIYGFFLNPKYDRNIAVEEGLAIKMVSYISEVSYTYDTNAIPTGQDSGVTVNELHNIKSSNDCTFGQVPYRSGGINAFAGGLYKADGNELVGFQRNAEGSNYNLLELVGRELIHFNKSNYNRLSGTIKNLNKEPLMFNRLFVREGKKYYPYNCSLNVISNEMNITAMQEVEPYTTASFSEIHSEVTTGGATVGGGNNTVLQYSEDAGNAKRVYELQTATEAEQEGGYVLVDAEGYPEARKVAVSEIGGMSLQELVEHLAEDYGLSVTQKDGVKYLESKHSFYTLGGLASGEPSNDTPAIGGGSNVSFKAELLSGTKIGTITIDNVATNIYAPSALPNPYALTINGITYDGSESKTITISGSGGGVSGDYLPLGGGTITSAYETPLYINTSSTQSRITFQVNGTNKSLVGYNPSYGVWMYNFVCNKFIGLKDDGTPFYYDTAERTLIHSGNIGSCNAGSASKVVTNGVELTYNDKTSLSQFKLKGEKGGYSGMLFRDDSKGLAAIDNGTECGLFVTNMRWLLAYNRTNDVAWIDAPLSINNKLEVNNGNVLIGTTTDNGKKLQVEGTITSSNWYYSYNDTGWYSAKYNGGIYMKDDVYVTVYNSKCLQIQSNVANRDAALRTERTDTGYSCFFGLGSGGVNRGIWDNNYNKWLINASNDGYTYLANDIMIKQDKWDNGLILNRTVANSGASIVVMANGVRLGNFGLNGSKKYEFNVQNSSGTSTVVMSCDANGNFEAIGGVASRQPSDRRLKENICTISTTDAVSVLRKLNPITFKWNALATSLDSRNTGDSVGFIADEYEGLIVNSGRDIWGKYRAIDYTKAIPYLAKGWQIHDAILVKHADNIEDLRSRVEALESENRELKQRLNMRA